MAQKRLQDGANASIPAIQITLRQIVKAANANAAEIDASLKDWGYYTNNVEYTGTETIIAAGTVLECTLGTNTLYRFINGTNNANGYPIEDSFYSDFDGINLTNLIVTRGA